MANEVREETNVTKMRICTNQVQFFAMNGLLQDILLSVNSDLLMAALLREFIS